METFGIADEERNSELMYTVFHKKATSFSFFHNVLKWSIYMKFLPVVGGEILI